MSKKVISFRLSEDELAKLDLASQRFGKSRSETVALAIKMLARDYVNENGTIRQRVEWVDLPKQDMGK